MNERGKMPLFAAHHCSRLSYPQTGNGDEPGTLSPLHLSSEEPGGVALQGARSVRSCAGGRNHSETCTGCIAACTPASNCSRNWSRSTPWRRVALKAATVLAASYLLR